jgi:serine/threonine protein kinase
MAPEAWKGVTDLLDQRVDVYSLGVILFRVLAGQLPFSGDTLKDKFVNATSAARPSLQRLRPDLPSDIDQWVELALAADRDRRFQNVRALWNVFLSVLHLPSPKRPSFWAAAKGAVQRAFSGPPAPIPAPVPRSAAPGLPGGQEPSFMREALAKSMLHVPTPSDPGFDETRDEPKTGVERTLSMSDSDIAYELAADESAPVSDRRKK